MAYHTHNHYRKRNGSISFSVGKIFKKMGSDKHSNSQSNPRGRLAGASSSTVAAEGMIDAAAKEMGDLNDDGILDHEYSYEDDHDDKHGYFNKISMDSVAGLFETLRHPGAVMQSHRRIDSDDKEDAEGKRERELKLELLTKEGTDVLPTDQRQVQGRDGKGQSQTKDVGHDEAEDERSRANHSNGSTSEAQLEVLEVPSRPSNGSDNATTATATTTSNTSSYRRALMSKFNGQPSGGRSSRSSSMDRATSHFAPAIVHAQMPSTPSTPIAPRTSSMVSDHTSGTGSTLGTSYIIPTPPSPLPILPGGHFQLPSHIPPPLATGSHATSHRRDSDSSDGRYPAPGPPPAAPLFVNSLKDTTKALPPLFIPPSLSLSVLATRTLALHASSPPTVPPPPPPRVSSLGRLTGSNTSSPQPSLSLPLPLFPVNRTSRATALTAAAPFPPTSTHTVHTHPHPHPASPTTAARTILAIPKLPGGLALPGTDFHPNSKARPLPVTAAAITAPATATTTTTQSAHLFTDTLSPVPEDIDIDIDSFPDFPDPLDAPDSLSLLTPATFVSASPAGSRPTTSSRPDSPRNRFGLFPSTSESRLDIWDQKPAPLARRMSLDSLGLVPQRPDTYPDSLPSSRYASPRKLTKRRPSQDGTASSPVSRARARSRSGSASGLVAGGATNWDPLPPPLPPASAPPPNLPPIVSLPPLDPDPESGFQLAPPPSRAMSRASPGLSTSDSVFDGQYGNAGSQSYPWRDISNSSRTASPAMRPGTTLLPPAPVARERDRDGVPEKRTHSRSRSAAKTGNGDLTKTKDRSSSKPSQKAMLSKALSMANTAVQLDNAQNYIAAREAYVEACDLLQHVLARTNGEDDRNKLEAIRTTYTSRIEELDGLVAIDSPGDKELPERPDSFDYHGVQMELARNDTHSDATTIAKSQGGGSPTSRVSSRTMRRPSDVTTYSDFSRNADMSRGRRLSSFSRSPMRRHFEGGALTIPHPQGDSVLPAPLSPRRPISPARVPSPEPVVRQDFSLSSQRERLGAPSDFRSHRRNVSHESGSWLDPIDESGGSTTSSVHSRSSSRIMRKHIRQPSGDTEAEFDAALDAAVEAAYDEGYEPSDAPGMGYDEIDEDPIATSMRRVELAKELARQTERENSIQMARERERQRQLSIGQDSQTYGGDFFDANDSDEEEERMLEEMTRDYVMEDFALNQQGRSQSSLPRESASSGFTSRTWHSSMGSNPPTATTMLSGISERPSSSNLRKPSSPPMPPPTQSLPQPPQNRPSSSAGVRNRRLSGQNTKQLKIETSQFVPSSMPPAPLTESAVIHSQPATSFIAQQRQAQALLSGAATRVGPLSARAPSSPVRSNGLADATGSASPQAAHDNESRANSQTNSPSSTRPVMRKNYSTSSLKSLKTRQISVSHIDETDPPPMTPISQSMSNSSASRLPTMPVLPTPLMTSFPDNKIGGGIGGLHLFESDFHSPVTQSPNSTLQQQLQNPDMPLPLEPCPADPMFRPFWLMRALYQTLAHPRGGYISNRLFVPQDAWKVKGVKLRNVEDKISQCDLLTAALQKLARVDSTDADAMLDEMQTFENIFEMAQATLTRRLGAEVGSQGMITFRDEKESEAPAVPRNNSISGKGGAFSWRRLRSKGSAVNLASAYGSMKANGNGAGTAAVSGIPERDVASPGVPMPSLPMVTHPSSRPAKRDVASAKFDGPNANYMASLARLFDAAQTVDQIARQVDDPGLRHADKTQVGLELCTRHAAEFFGFYICRFVLADLGMLLDKFVKRGTEWVLN